MSVVIVHRDGWACTDSRSSMGGCIFPDVVEKAVVTSTMLISIVGQAIVNQMVNRIVKNTAEGEILDAIAEMFSPDNSLEASLLVVNKNREMMHIDANGYISKIDPAVKYWAAGCADGYVLGYLAAIGDDITPDHAEAAIKSAARWDTGIDDRVQRVFLNQ
jgi:hypothetical protein